MNNMPIIVVDIETIPAQTPAARDYLAATVKPPGTIKLAASIEKWYAESKESAVDEAVSKTGLDGALGQVVCIGYQLPGMIEPAAAYGMNEANVLSHFNEVLDGIPRNQWSAVTVVGHNIVGFDLRFLLQRYIVNGIRPHAIINVAAQAKAWDSKVYDTMTQFAGFGKTISLDKLCFALDIEGKGKFTWEDVLPAMLDGRGAEVADYCKHDVSITREVYQRMTFAEPKAEFDELPF
jgi:hypothetical protein